MEPIVVGHPRTGFTLLISVLAELMPYSNREEVSPVVRAVRALCDTAGMQIAARIEGVFQRHGLLNDLIYNYNFKQLAGGPKWLKAGDNGLACFRKYIGIRGQGDFTVITSHPRQVLRYYDILHSHADPARWAEDPEYRNGQHFASIRHPAGTLASACFSLNALASEYIQRFVPPDADNDMIRQRLALYKLSDLNFFEALIGPFKAYLEEFCGCIDRYTVMRWEDLIQAPIQTIQTLGNAIGILIQDSEAAEIWRRLDHVNLTGAHKHNYRYGHGVVGGWRRWLTNTHLDVMRDYGLEQYAERFGYGAFSSLNEQAYTPFQKTLDAYIKRGEAFRDYGDEDLFGFAFNKSNLDLTRFAFKRYEWRTHTQIERSSCTNERLVMDVWDAAEEACGLVNEALHCVWCEEERFALDGASGVDDVIAILRPLFITSEARESCRKALIDAIQPSKQGMSRAEPGGSESCVAPPILLQSVGTTNIVVFGGLYYALPQCLGPIDLQKECVRDWPGVEIADSLSGILARVAQ